MELREVNSLVSGAAHGDPASSALVRADGLVDSYRRLADVFHEVLSEQTHSTVLERIADSLADVIPYDAFTVYQADETRRLLIPVMARDRWADEIMSDRRRSARASQAGRSTTASLSSSTTPISTRA